MSNSFKIYPTNFSRGGKKFARWGFAPPGYGPGNHCSRGWERLLNTSVQVWHTGL